MQKRMSMEEAVSYIEEIPKFTEKHELAHTRKLLKSLGDPQKDLSVIHVAGTNGKGSVCAYLQAMFLAMGKTVGFFTSPHLIRINERICLNGVPVDDETFTDAFCTVRNKVEEMSGEGFAHPSYFEFLFAMGMLVFGKWNPDVIILETGLGGRLDATNCLESPKLCVITSISLDHTQYLGDTVEQIAWEKAGIIKPQVPVIFDGTDPRAAEVIRARAEALAAPCVCVRPEDLVIEKITDREVAFSRKDAYDNTVWTLSNSGIYQSMNAALSIAAMETWMHPDGREDYALWRDALSKVKWEGRMEEVLPGVYVDGAHNPGAVDAFLESLLAITKGRPEEKDAPVFLFSAVADKEYEVMIKNLCERYPAKAYVLTELDGGRKLTTGQLREVFERFTDRPVYEYADKTEAFLEAVKLAGEGKLYCLGSLYLAGPIKEIAKNVKF